MASKVGESSCRSPEIGQTHAFANLVAPWPPSCVSAHCSDLGMRFGGHCGSLALLGLRSRLFCVNHFLHSGQVVWAHLGNAHTQRTGAA